MLCSILGKFAQQTNQTESKFVHSQYALNKLFLSENIDDILCFDKVCHVLTRSKKKSKINRSANCVIYAYVTAYARIYMHEQMIKIWNAGGLIYGIENDCLLWARHMFTLSPLTYSHRFGNFKIDCTNVTSYISFGPKASAITIKTPNGSNTKIKARGFNLQSKLIHDMFTPASFYHLIETYLRRKDLVTIGLPQIRHRQDFAALKVTPMIKNHHMTNVITSTRVVFNNFISLPYGYTKK